MPEMIIFWEWDKWDDKKNIPIYRPIPVEMVLKEYEIDGQDLYNAFIEWADRHYQGEYHHKVHDKKYIVIHKPSFNEYVTGHLSLKRPWGNHWRFLNYHYIFFSVEMVLPV